MSRRHRPEILICGKCRATVAYQGGAKGKRCPCCNFPVPMSLAYPEWTRIPQSAFRWEVRIFVTVMAVITVAMVIRQIVS